MIHQNGKLGLMQTLMLGCAGGLVVGAIYVIRDMFYGGGGTVPSLPEGMLTVIVALFIMSFIEHRIGKRGKEWERCEFAMAIAAALGLSIVYGYAYGGSDGVRSFVVLLPVALIATYAAKLLFRETHQ